MDDFMQVLLIIGIIVFGVFRQINKDRKENPEEEIPTPMPPASPAPAPMEIPARKLKSKKQSTAYKPIEEGTLSTFMPPVETSPPPVDDALPAEESEYAIQSPEDAKRAIVWSEILQRKY